MAIFETMRPLRNRRLKWLFAVLALWGVLLHAGVLVQHSLMQIAAAAPESAAEQWARDNNIPICHAAGKQQPAPSLPANYKVTHCVICASALASTTAQEPSQLGRVAPLGVVIVYTPSQAQTGYAKQYIGFEARGPPTAV